VTAQRDYQTVITYIIDNDYHYYTKNEEENGTGYMHTGREE